MNRWGRFEWTAAGALAIVEAAWLWLLYVGAAAVVSWAVAP